MMIDILPFMREWRGLRDKDGAKITQGEYELVMSAINGTWQPAPVATDEPAWMAHARQKIGEREIKGPKHNRWIADGWRRLGAGWYNSDEVPWCGLFAADCIDAAGLPYPKMFPRAKAWLDWGVEVLPAVGAVVVFGRTGGGHVGFLAGESAEHWYVLGGNQRDAVNIMPIAKSRTLGFRWPAQVPFSAIPLPRMRGGIVSRNEA